MKIIIAGGSGHLGTLLCHAMHHSGHEIVVLSRSPQNVPWRTVAWDGQNQGPWTAELDGADGIINLAGLSVDCRYHARNRKRLVDSRILSTRVIGQAIHQCKQAPKFWLQMSTATIYQHTFGDGHTEKTGVIGASGPNEPPAWQFSIDLATAWEQEALRWQHADTRQILLRTAMVMSMFPGGVFRILQRLTRLGLGGKVAHGKQFVSWMHHLDFVAAIEHLIENESLAGVFNICAPNPLPHAQFMATLRRNMGIKIGLPTPKWMLEIGAFFMRTESELLLKSRRVLPANLLASGFEFRFPDWSSACEDLCESTWQE